MTEVPQQAGRGKTAIRPFRVNAPEAELTELRRRIAAAKWPERETVTDDSQGVPLAMIQPHLLPDARAGRPLRGLEQPQLFSAEIRAGFRPLRTRAS
jgi:hypothetical protein